MTKATMILFAQRRLRSAWASAQSDQSLRCPREESLVLSCPLSAQRRLCSDWPDAQANLSLRWAHTHFVGFVISRLICCCQDCFTIQNAKVGKLSCQNLIRSSAPWTQSIRQISRSLLERLSSDFVDKVS